MRTLIALLAASAALFTAPAHAADACDEKCLLSLADKTIAAIAAKDYRRLPWADPVKYSENNVPLMIDDAWWGSAGPTVGPKAFAVADESTGNAIWFGTIWDHDAPAFGAIRIRAPGGKIAEIEVIAARKPWPVPFGDPKSFALSPDFAKTVPVAGRRSRERLVDLADAYLATKQRNNGALLAQFGKDCTIRENGTQVSGIETEPALPDRDCAAALSDGLFAPVERIRDRRFPIVDPARGLVVSISVQDVPVKSDSFRSVSGQALALKRPYPMSRLVAEVVKIDGDTVVRAEGVAAFLPYYMPTPWMK